MFSIIHVIFTTHHAYLRLRVARRTNPICNFDCLRWKSLSRDHQKARITDKRETIIDFAGVSGRRLTPARCQYMCIY